MKKSLQYGIVLLFLGFSINMSAQVKNYLGFHVQAAEWSLLPQTENEWLHNSLGINGGLGLSYELRKNDFLFDLGLTGAVGYTSFNVDSYTTSILGTYDQDPLFPPYGEKFDFVYDVHDRRDSYMNVALQIPVLVGAQINKFYFLAGVKANLSLMAQTNFKAKMTSYGVYNQYDIHENMPDRQFFTDLPFSSKGPASFNFDVDASIEIGWRLGFVTKERGFDVPKQKKQYRIALFADYGLLDIHKNGSNTLIEAPIAYNRNDMVSALQMHDVLSVNKVASRVNNLMVGIKFTALFELPGKRNCVICRDELALPKAHRGGVRKMED